MNSNSSLVQSPIKRTQNLLEKKLVFAIIEQGRFRKGKGEKMDLRRTAYDRLLSWKKTPNHGTLEVSGARQVGKTYLVNKFADQEYVRKLYVNLLEMDGELFLEHYHDIRQEMHGGKRIENPVLELMKRYDAGFEDAEDTLIIIDEIQESPEIYNRIREFTRRLRSDFIVTGSYLGRIMNKGFKYSSGDMSSLEIKTLNFEEFLMAAGEYGGFENLDIFGGSADTVYEKLTALYQIYSQIGGYPAVVLRYLDGATVSACQDELVQIIRLFTAESRRYFEDILDYEAYGNLFCSIARVLVREKKGLKEDSFSEELQGIVAKDYSSNLNKASVNRAIDWLYSSGVVGFAGKVINCSILDFRAKARCYFMDMGLATYFLQQIGCTQPEIDGVLSETFVYLDLKRRMGDGRELAFEMPAFATYGDGELDFLTKSLKTHKIYGIEVKAGKNSGKTAMEVLEKGKVDCLLFAKGNTHGGMNENIYTIPIYGISKFDF